MSINGELVIDILGEINETIKRNKEYLTELDAVIGDGDHGLNMARGFENVMEKIKNDDEKNIGNILKKVGMALVSSVGGASGPLYGTAFLKAGNSVNDKYEVDIRDFLQILKEALEGVKMRGKAERGDKTMIDVLFSAIDSMENAMKEGKSDIDVLKEMRDGAFKGVEYTKEIIAKKGRASYLGDRSIGHQDAGATSCALILETIYEEVKSFNIL